MKILRYAPQNIGYCAWTPEAGKGLPDLWFSCLTDLNDFAAQMGYKLKRI